MRQANPTGIRRTTPATEVHELYRIFSMTRESPRVSGALPLKTGPRRGAYFWTVGFTLFPEEVAWKAPGAASAFVR